VHKATRRHRIRLRRFAGEYLFDLNGTAAIKRMGFKGKRPDVAASRLMTHPQFAQMLEEAIEERAKRVDVDHDYVLKLLIEQAERARGRHVQGGSAIVIKAAHLLGSHLGMWKTKHLHGGPNGEPLMPPQFNVTFEDGGPGS
jgi:hypothetical protein